MFGLSKSEKALKKLKEEVEANRGKTVLNKYKCRYCGQVSHAKEKWMLSRGNTHCPKNGGRDHVWIKLG